MQYNNSNIMFIVTVYFLFHYHDHYLASQAHHAGLNVEVGQVNWLRFVTIPVVHCGFLLCVVVTAEHIESNIC